MRPRSVQSKQQAEEIKEQKPKEQTGDKTRQLSKEHGAYWTFWAWQKEAGNLKRHSTKHSSHQQHPQHHYVNGRNTHHVLPLPSSKISAATAAHDVREIPSKEADHGFRGVPWRECASSL